VEQQGEGEAAVRIKWHMIDRDLRWPGFIGRHLMIARPWFLRLLARLSKKGRGRSVDGLHCEEMWIPRSGEASEIRVRIYRRIGGTAPAPVLLYLHGGGYAVGTPEDSGSVIKTFIDARDCIVVAPDYRKSLEAPYPAAIDDSYDTLLWIRANVESLGVRPDQIMVGGYSAGGGLTAAVTLRARDRGDVKIAFQMPIYPMIDDRMESESARDNDAPLWNSRLNALAWDFYLKDLKQDGRPIPYDAAPARAEDLSGLPPTMTYVGDLEPFRDETIAYVESLKKAGVPVEFALFEGCFHGFDIVAPNAGISRQARAFAVKCFEHAVDHHRAPQG
jgi:acetyl esterase/lipase